MCNLDQVLSSMTLGRGDANPHSSRLGRLQVFLATLRDRAPCPLDPRIVAWAADRIAGKIQYPDLHTWWSREQAVNSDPAAQAVHADLVDQLTKMYKEAACSKN